MRGESADKTSSWLAFAAATTDSNNPAAHSSICVIFDGMELQSIQTWANYMYLFASGRLNKCWIKQKKTPVRSLQAAYPIILLVIKSHFQHDF